MNAGSWDSVVRIIYLLPQPSEKSLPARAAINRSLVSSLRYKKRPLPKALLDFVSRKTKVDACQGLPQVSWRCRDTEAQVTLSLRVTIKSVPSTWIQKPKSHSWGERYRARERARNVLIKEPVPCEFHFLERVLRSSFFSLHCHQLSSCCAGFLSTTPSPQCASKLLSPLLFSLAGKIFGAGGMGTFSKLRYQIIFHLPVIEITGSGFASLWPALLLFSGITDGVG